MSKTDFRTIKSLVREDYECIIKLNTPYNKRAIQYIYWDIFDKRIPLKDIHISDKDSMLRIGKENILCWDKHHHYPDLNLFIYSNFLWLKSVEETLQMMKSKEIYKKINNEYYL